MSQSESAPARFTSKSLEAIASLTATFQRHGICEIRVSASGMSTRLMRTHLLEAIADLGATPVAFPTNVPTVYAAQVGYAGAMFDGLVTAEDLPSIGYHLVDGKPVPLKSEATA